ncbi:hypothetical protein L7F22_047906 [Adiantum nelumboides]|nr:hypothetical protein [Adiantum nelumboides]
MTGHMLQANECLAADIRRLLAPQLLSSFKTCPTVHSQAFSSVSLHCKLVAPPKLREGSWVTPRFCISAFNRESEQAKDTGFQRKKIAVFVSGGGSNFRNLHEASVQNKVFGDFVLVVSDKPDTRTTTVSRDIVFDESFITSAEGAAALPIPILPPPSLPDPPASPVITPSTSHPVPPIQPPDVSPDHALSDSDSDLDVADATPEVDLAPPRREKRIPGWLYSTVASSGVTELPVPPPAGLPRRNTLTGFCDSDWAGDSDSRKSVSGYCFTLGCGTISWTTCKACEYAKNNNIPIVQYPHNKVENSGLSAGELLAMLRQFEVDILLLAGYLKLLPSEIVQAFSQAILNIHPALLPSFGGKGYYGRKVHEAVIKSGARYSGPTIHFVDEKYDHGSIVAQRLVPVLPHDTPEDLAVRVLKEEHKLYPEVVAAICEDRIFWREDGAPLIRRSWDEAEYY